jgi:predicted AAA+ superfamily ATPase
MAFVPRALSPQLHEILDDTRVTVILGPRQAGKSTLARTLLDEGRLETYVTLDDQAVRGQANADPEGFVAALERPVVIDEIQRAPALMLAIKTVVDRDPRPGQFVITGSANLLTQRGVADALPGRAEYLRLWPFAQSELRSADGTLIDRLFAGDPPRLYDQSPGLVAYADKIARGGFPDAHHRNNTRRQAYFRAYVDTLLGRDLRDIAAPQVDTSTIPQLLRVLATRSGDLASFESLARDLQVNPRTARGHTGLLEQLFLVHQLRPWSRNISQREVKTPKILITDSGLLCALVGATADRLVADAAVAGKAVETFAFNELLRQSGWSEQSLNGLFFYRDRNGREVDVVAEATDGRVIGFEVKTAASVSASDSLGLRFLRDQVGERFVGGAVLYTGSTTLPLGDRVWAIPLAGLWS